MQFALFVTFLAYSALGLAEPIQKDSPDCQKRPDKCLSPIIDSPEAQQPSSTILVLSTTTYTTSFCSVTNAVPFTRNATWYEQSCTQIIHTTTTTDYNLQWGCETSTVTTAYTMDDSSNRGRA